MAATRTVYDDPQDRLAIWTQEQPASPPGSPKGPRQVNEQQRRSHDVALRIAIAIEHDQAGVPMLGNEAWIGEVEIVADQHELLPPAQGSVVLVRPPPHAIIGGSSSAVAPVLQECADKGANRLVEVEPDVLPSDRRTDGFDRIADSAPGHGSLSHGQPGVTTDESRERLAHGE